MNRIKDDRPLGFFEKENLKQNVKLRKSIEENGHKRKNIFSLMKKKVDKVHVICQKKEVAHRINP